MKLILSILLSFNLILISTVGADTVSKNEEMSLDAHQIFKICKPEKSYLWHYVSGVIIIGLIIMYYEHKKSKL